MKESTGRCALVAFVWLIASAIGCSPTSKSVSHQSVDGAPAPAGDAGSAASAGNTASAGSTADAGNTASTGNTAGAGNVLGQTGDVMTGLPPLPTMTHVTATQGNDSASITFDPVDGAKDYRVYPLPADGDISVSTDGAVTIHNAIYRCAGTRESPPPALEDKSTDATNWMVTIVENEVGGYSRTLADATLGYVYTDPGPGLVPVYALGESDPGADQSCGYSRWAASRSKLYTTSDSVRSQMLAAFARDDGIAFYVPAAADATTAQMYVAGSKDQRLYMVDGPEAATHSDKTPSFFVSKTQVAGTEPLMRVFYANNCGWSHDELAVGQERFNRIRNQGDKLPWWSLLWTGLTEPTTLVVEALDSGCPFQGLLSPESLPSEHAGYGSSPIIHQPWLTLDDVRNATPSGEVFINGQYGLAWDTTKGTTTTPAAPSPKAIARSFVKVAPQAAPKMDFLATFSPGTMKETFASLGTPAHTQCAPDFEEKSATFDVAFDCVEGAPMYKFGPVLGELWVDYADGGADTNGKFRLTANQKAVMNDSTYLHVTMEVDGYSTARRYPQILISDRDAPIQWDLENGHAIVVQPRATITPWYDFPVNYELQICNQRFWDVNQQCPVYYLHGVFDDNGSLLHYVPNDELSEFASADHRILFDVYASTRRTYLFLEGKPYGCADMAAGVPSGPVTVTWGDVLYHSGVDHTFNYHQQHMQVDMHRHFDNLGFTSGVPQPAWDETRFPCAAATSISAGGG